MVLNTNGVKFMKRLLISAALVLSAFGAYASEFSYPADIANVGWSAKQERKAYNDILKGFKEHSNDPASMTIKPKDVVFFPWKDSDGFDDEYRAAFVTYRAKNGFGALVRGERICKIKFDNQQVDHCMSLAD
jgi:hypothetical protein